MKTIFTIKKELQAQVDLLTKEVEGYKTKVSDLESKVNTGISLEDYNAVKAENVELTKQVDALVKQLEEADMKVKEANVKEQKVEQLASDKALEIIQQTGSPAINVEEKPVVADQSQYRYKTVY